MNLHLDRGAHVCHLYRTSAEQKHVMLPVARKALKQNECCFLTTLPDTIDDWFMELQAYGIDVQQERERRGLIIKGIRPPSENFNAIRQGRDLWRAVKPLMERFGAVWMLRELPWLAEYALSPEQLCHFEITKTMLFEDTDVRSICQFDLSQHPPAIIHTALRTHPLVFFEGKSLKNPFFDGPAILEQEPAAFASHADALEVDRMLAHFR